LKTSCNRGIDYHSITTGYLGPSASRPTAPGSAMDDFHYENGSLYCESARLRDVAAEFGTPVYVYSRSTFNRHLSEFRTAFAPLDPQIRYAVKACGNVHLLREANALGAGADVVSGGELYRALCAGIPAERVVFAGVGKTTREMGEAIEAGVGCFNVESAAELETLNRVAAGMGRTARAAIRVNPDVSGHETPDKTTTGVRGNKFGVDLEHVPALFDRGRALDAIDLDGLHIHLGSPIYSPDPYAKALEKILALASELGERGHEIRTINIGGGFAAQYQTGLGPGLDEYAATIVPVLEPFVAAGGQVLIEPGRSVAANAGVLLTEVLFLKEAGSRRVAIVDAGMSSFMRTAVYDAFHFIWPVEPRDGLVPPRRAEELELDGLRTTDVAGPICESSDYLGRGRDLPPLSSGEVLCVFGAGAYGMTMASHYNSMPRPPEVLIDRGEARLIRRRESYADLVDAEFSLAELTEQLAEVANPSS
jgi:diaminopimelate decarboxylase